VRRYPPPSLEYFVIDMKQPLKKILLSGMICFLIFLMGMTESFGQNNLAQMGQATVSSTQKQSSANAAIDGDMNTFWSSEAEDRAAWVTVRLPGATELTRISIQFGPERKPNSKFHLQYLLNGEWRIVETVENNTSVNVDIELKKELLTDRIRLAAADQQPMQVIDFGLYGQVYVDTVDLAAKPVLVNQSGYNLHRPKRFSAPEIKDHTPFVISEVGSEKVLYEGVILGGKGDFSGFDPRSPVEYTVKAAGEESFPFRIGPNWLERVSYRSMLDFMVGARHYVGNVPDIRPISFEWRDGDFFNWAMQSLVAMYLSNPEAYERMEVTSKYVPNESFPEQYRGYWGELDGYGPETPDIIQLIHWDADVKVSKRLDHEMQKAELAHFLYAWPYLKKWLPQQNFDAVYAYATSVWEKAEVSKHSLSQYDLSPEHNLLALKTQLGTTKGEMPPGFSVIPNLMMYEVALREGAPDAEKYFKAAYKQMEWMIENLDWQDPMTTKGQRMSEHMTMRAFAYFHTQFPDRRPEGIKEKVHEWAKIAISRSDNMWDFRKYDEDEWTPPGWNETGNILGFPAAAFAAMTVLEDSALIEQMEILAWSNFENAFGRNPTGRHFSYKGPEEVEGVDLGWYSRHKGGIGLLDELPFVFDGSPKSFHYPNHPEAGNVGWTEGWVQFNTAYNISMAYMANYYADISLTRSVDNQLLIQLKAPLNFHQEKIDSTDVQLCAVGGKCITVKLVEDDPYSELLSGTVETVGNEIRNNGQVIRLKKGDKLSVSYGYGFFIRKAQLIW
jgi:hypothetical protein